MRRVGGECGGQLDGMVEKRLHAVGAAAVDQRLEIPADLLGAGRGSMGVGGSHEGWSVRRRGSSAARG